MKLFRYNPKNGQVLVIMVFVMLIALAIGTGISSTLIGSLRNISDTDSSNRALAVAEAGVEKMLLLPMSTLEGYINFGNCGSECVITIIGNDGITAIANITLSYLGQSTDPYPVELNTADIVEINLNGYPNTTNLQVCWNNPEEGELPSVTGLYYFGSSGSYSVDSYAYNSAGSLNGNNGFNTAYGAGGYTNCFTVTGKTNPKILRLKSIYNDIEAFVVPASGSSVPSQGIMIESQGEVAGLFKKATAVRTNPHLPEEFDYILYSKSASDPLSN